MSFAARADRRRHPRHQEVRQKVHLVIEPHYSQYLQNIQRSLVRWLFSADIMMQLHGTGALSVNVFRMAQGAQSSPGDRVMSERGPKNKLLSFVIARSKELRRPAVCWHCFFKVYAFKNWSIIQFFSPPPPCFLALYWCCSFRCGCSYWVISFKDANL